MVFLRFCAAVLFLICTFTDPVQAHRAGESYIFLDISDTQVTGRFEVTLNDLNKVISIDVNGDGELTEQEFNAVVGQVNGYMQQTLAFNDGKQSYSVDIIGNGTRQTELGTFAKIEFNIPALNGVPEGLHTEYRFLFDDLEPSHRGLLVIENNTLTGVVDKEANIAGIFGPGESTTYIRFTPLAWYETAGRFIQHGAWHIWIGYDHILFIVSLLLPSVMVVRNGRHQPVDNFSQAMWSVIAVITLFTISHSISLSLAALDIVRLPSRLVESVIAASITVAALNNIIPIFARRMAIVVFFFGLFHGFGFANVLAPLDLQQSSLVSSLVGFNLGVELGQIVIIATVFPLLYFLKNKPSYDRVILKFGSVGLIGISSMWFVKRAFGL